MADAGKKTAKRLALAFRTTHSCWSQGIEAPAQGFSSPEPVLSYLSGAVAQQRMPDWFAQAGMPFRPPPCRNSLRSGTLCRRVG